MALPRQARREGKEKVYSGSVALVLLVDSFFLSFLFLNNKELKITK